MTVVGRRGFSIRPSVIVVACLPVALVLLLIGFRSGVESADYTADRSLNASGSDTAISGVAPHGSSMSVESTAPSVAAVQALVIDESAPTAPDADRARIVVFPPRVDFPGRLADSFVEKLHATLIGLLRATPEFEVIELDESGIAGILPGSAAVSAETVQGWAVLAREYEGDVLVRLREKPATNGQSRLLEMMLYSGPRQATQGFMFGDTGNRGSGNDPETIAAGIVQSIRSQLNWNDREIEARQAAVDARSILLDPERADDERLESLDVLGRSPYDAETIAAAIDIASRSTSPAARRQAWLMLRRKVYDPALQQPLLTALITDPDADVRKEVALSLGEYRSDPGVLVSLRQAQASDGSPEVRLAAEIALLDFDEQRAFSRERLLDRNLTPAERLAPAKMIESMQSPNVVAPTGNYDSDEARAIAEIAAASTDTEQKVDALSRLPGAFFLSASRDRELDPDVRRVLIDSATHEDSRVRTIALSALRSEIDEPDVRALFERAVAEDPTVAERLRMVELMEQVRN